MANPRGVDRRYRRRRRHDDAAADVEVVVKVLPVLVGVLIALVLGAGSAAADPPARLDDRVTDRAGVLGAGATQVDAAIERLRTEGGLDLFVVFVESFDGADGPTWADDTARLSQLGDRDALLAVAVGDRAYGLSVTAGFPLGDSALDRILADDVEPRLGANDWAGAAVAMADGLRTGGGGSGSSGWLIGLVIVGGAVVAGAYVLHRRRRRSVGAAPGGGESAAPTGTADEFADVSTADLAYRASAALIEVDDAVRTSEQELAAARAHFGAEAVAEFGAALEQSRADMLRAFALRQQLDDGEPEDEPEQRAMNGEIIRIATTADDRLDSHTQAFDELRGLEARAAGFVDGLGARLDGVSTRVPDVEAAWSVLQQRYAATALEPVAGDVDQARELLTAARAELAEARQDLAGAGDHAVTGPGRRGRRRPGGRGRDHAGRGAARRHRATGGGAG
jgi:TLP18.3/Psb32/MOLO-1 phosphatase superfamily protein